MTGDEGGRDRRLGGRRFSDRYPVEFGRAFDDEISLADLVRALWRRRWVVLGVAAAATGLAVLHAMTTPPKYEYTAALQIGYQPDTDRSGDRLVSALQTPAIVIAELESADLPRAVRAARAEFAGGDQEPPVPGITVESPGESRTIRLHATAPEAHGPLYRAVMDHALQAVVARHRGRYENERASYEARLAKAKLELERLRNETLFDNRLADHRDSIEAAREQLSQLQGSREVLVANREARLAEQRRRIADARRRLSALEDSRELLTFRLDRLDDRRELLQGQANRLEGFVERASEYRLAASQANVDPGDAMSLMLLGDQAQRLRTRLEDIEQQLAVDLPERRESLRSELADNTRQQVATREHRQELERGLTELEASFDQKIGDNERAQRSQARELSRLERELEAMRIEHRQAIATAEQDVRALEARVASLVPTRVLSEPSRSLRPVGVSGKIVVALGLVLGLMAGVVLALLVDAVVRARADGVHAATDRPSDTPQTGRTPYPLTVGERRRAG